MRLGRRRRRRLGRHAPAAPSSAPMPTAPPARRPVRRRPPEELHPRRAGRPSPGRLRPLALGGAAGTGITQVRGTWWHALHDGIEQRIGVDTGPAASTSLPRPTRPTSRRAISSPASRRRCRLRRPPALRPGRGQVVQPRPGSWSAMRRLTIDVEDDSPPAAGIAGGTHRRRLAPGRPGVGFWAGTTSAAASASAKRRRRRPGQPDRISWARPDRRRAGGRRRCSPARSGRSGTRRRSTPPFSDGPHAIHHCAIDFAGNAAARHADALIDNNPPAHPRPARSPEAKAGTGSTTSTSPGAIPIRARRARSAVPIGGSPAPRLRHRRQVRPPASDRRAPRRSVRSPGR